MDMICKIYKFLTIIVEGTLLSERSAFDFNRIINIQERINKNINLPCLSNVTEVNEEQDNIDDQMIRDNKDEERRGRGTKTPA